MALETQTRKLLGELRSPEEFERLTTEILRASGGFYATLAHVGTNTAGGTVKSPVDGIAVVYTANQKLLVLVQHTVTARAGLRRKWLDPECGDIAKSRLIAQRERGRRAVDRVVLALTTNIEPDEQLIRDVYAEAGTDIEVDIWSGSRLASFLDGNPDGQWLRSNQFCVAQTRLSAALLREISAISLAHYLPQVSRESIVGRSLDAGLCNFADGLKGVGFVVGGSGQGKSIACRRLADRWFANGGNALVIAHETIEQAASLDQALAITLRHWSPALNLRCGQEALALSPADRPILLIVEDLNLSGNPRRLLNRLLGWSQVHKADGEDPQSCAVAWRLLCPVWRSNTGMRDTQLRAQVENSSFAIGSFDRKEAAAAIIVRADAAGRKFTPLQLDELARALGDDPLLIGLNQDWAHPSATRAMLSYVEQSIEEAADDSLLPADLRLALKALASQLLRSRDVAPTWPVIHRWFREHPDTLAGIRRLIDQGRIVYLGDALEGERLLYRHDRLRDYLLADAIEEFIENDDFPDELWADPYYAGLIGLVLSRLSDEAVVRTAALNPVAIFSALHQATTLDVPDQRRLALLISLATTWVDSPEFKLKSTDNQRHHAMSYLAQTDAKFVPPLAERFPHSFPRSEALFRNGMVIHGASICYSSDPAVRHPWRDQIIAHTVDRFPMIVADLGKLILDESVSPKLFDGALNLAGEIGNPVLSDALAQRWRHNPDPSALSPSWIWATLRCCAQVEHPLLDEMTALWSSLPDKDDGDNRNRNPRWDVAGHVLPWALARKPDNHAIGYLIALAKRDRRLLHVISTIISKVDTPEAILFSIDVGAEFARRAKKNKSINFFGLQLKEAWNPDLHGRHLSDPSRAAAERIWRKRNASLFVRKTAFSVWQQTLSEAEVLGLNNLEDDRVLADSALRARLAAGDSSAAPLLRQRLANAKSPSIWWYQARAIGLDHLKDEVAQFMGHRRKLIVGGKRGVESDHIVAELLMDRRDAFSVEVLAENWDHLASSSVFVQAGLYLAAPRLAGMVCAAIQQSGDASEFLKHIDMNWGIKTLRRPGITDRAQLDAIVPYLTHLSEMPLCSFFEAANSLGELNWRKTYIDPLIGGGRRGYCAGDSASVFRSLDKVIEEYRAQRVRRLQAYWWFRRREEELWERKSLLRLVAEWSLNRGDEDSTLFLTDTVAEFGERSDLSLLQAINADTLPTVAERVSNCHYDVRRRTLR